MNAASLHDDAVILDGLVVSKWSRSVFEDMHAGGLTAANCTCCVWEGIQGTMDNLGHWNRWFAENEDLLLQVFTTADIARAKQEGKTGIILGWQNTSGIEDRIDYLALYKALGVGIMQMTYNTQNLVGCGCYESRDSGLSDFGRDVVDEMNRLGILCDLSHVGPVTSEDVIRHSKQPVAYTHCLPAGLKEHPRNKTDEQLRVIAAHDGFIGVTMFPAFLARGTDATVDDYVEAIDYVINLVGDDRVGFGTDFTQDYGRDFFDWLNHDKGYGRKLVEFGEVINPEGMRRIRDYPNLTAAMDKAGWGEARIRKVIGENWVGFLKEIWGA